MRPYLIFGLLILMVVGWVFHIVLRPLPRPPEIEDVENEGQDNRATKTSTIEVLTPGETKSGQENGKGEARLAVAEQRKSSGPKRRSAPDAGQGESTEEVVEGPPLLMRRPLKVMGLGWDLVATGIVANQGLTPGSGSQFLANNVAPHFRVTEDIFEIERALAEGGEDEEGADIAILPLPSLAAVYPDLEPLEPQIFWVTGWSHGQHEVGLGSAIPPDAQVIRAPMSDVVLAAESGSPAHFLSLFVLYSAGIDPSRVRLRARMEGADAGFEPAAVFGRTVPARRSSHEESAERIVSTIHASRAIPYVMVASRSFIESHQESLQRLVQIWHMTTREGDHQIPETARIVGTIEGAPEALELLGPLSRMRVATLFENARLAELSGSDSVTLESLFHLASELWLAAGVVTQPPPPVAPVATDAFAETVRHLFIELREIGYESSDTPSRSMAGVDEQYFPLLVIRGVDGVDRITLEHLGLVAGIFDPYPMRVQDGIDAERYQELMAVAWERYELSRARRIDVEAEGRPRQFRTPTGIELLAPR